MNAVAGVLLVLATSLSGLAQAVGVGAKPAPGAGSLRRSAVRGEGDAPRVFRGGSWLDVPDFNRSAKRLAFEPQRRRDFIGFRVAVNFENFR